MAFAIMAFTLMISSSAQAQATRTWVSGVGDDVNPCSRTAPCKTFAGAISKTAVGGEIDALDPGGFGTVTITKSITIDGTDGAGFGSILAAGTNGVNVNDSASATPNTAIVTLRNLSINGATTGLVGVNITAARNVFIEGCQIFGFKSGNGNAIRDARTVATNPAPQLWVTDSSLFNNSGSHINVIGAAAAGVRAFINRTVLYGGSSHGVQAQNSTTLTVRECDINGNLGDGVRIETNSKGNLVSSVINGNLTGVNNVSGTANLADLSVFSNGSGVNGTVVSFGNNNVRDNGGGNTLPPPVGQQ
jgi:hypothetical protein